MQLWDDIQAQEGLPGGGTGRSSILFFFNFNFNFWFGVGVGVGFGFLFAASQAHHGLLPVLAAFGNGRTHTGALAGSGGSRLANYSPGKRHGHNPPDAPSTHGCREGVVTASCSICVFQFWIFKGCPAMGTVGLGSRCAVFLEGLGGNHGNVLIEGRVLLESGHWSILALCPHLTPGIKR